MEALETSVSDILREAGYGYRKTTEDDGLREIFHLASGRSLGACRAYDAVTLALRDQVAINSARAPGALEQFHAQDDGWCEWHHPGKGPDGGFIMGCCGCGLQHDVEFKVHGKVDVPDGQAWPGEKAGRYLVWRLRQRS